jgi:TrmH family RNA methyltransferase
MTQLPKRITSAANPEIKRLRGLAARKRREEENLFLVEGLRHVQDGLAGGLELALLAYGDAARDDPALRAAASSCREGLIETTAELLGRITGRDNAQPVLGAFRPRWSELGEIGGGLWVGLEQVRDPGNLGTIIRTADAAGAEGIVLIGECCDPWAPETVRATMGSFARMKLARAGREDFAAWKQGWAGRMIGTHLRTDTDYRAADYSPPLLLLMGGESAGLSDELAGLCDRLVRIPMAGGAESLNLAVSTGIMLYEIGRATL